jgi:hypothetical protein
MKFDDPVKGKAVIKALAGQITKLATVMGAISDRARRGSNLRFHFDRYDGIAHRETPPGNA